MQGKSCFVHLTAFYNEISSLISETRTVGVVYLDFSKGFDSTIHNIVIDNLTRYRLDKWTV